MVLIADQAEDQSAVLKCCICSAAFRRISSACGKRSQGKETRKCRFRILATEEVGIRAMKSVKMGRVGMVIVV